MDRFINFSFCSIKIIIQDDNLLKEIENAFAITSVATADVKCEIKVNCGIENGYKVYVNDQKQSVIYERSIVAGYITSLIGGILSSNLDEHILLFHASSVLTKSGVISFLGPSGSGKTSLSLMFSKYGSYLGDEYAFFEKDLGNIYHESYPFQIKENNKYMIKHFTNRKYLLTKTEDFGMARYYAVTNVNYKQEKGVLEWMVFPSYDKNCKETHIEKLPINDFPVRLLSSGLSIYKPSKALCEIIKCINHNNMRGSIAF